MIVLYVSDSIILIPAMHVYVPWRFTCTTIIISIVMSMASVLRRVQIFSWSLTTSRQWSAQSWVLCRELISYITYADNPASFDAYEVAKPSDQLPLPALANILDSYESGVVKVIGVEWIMDWYILQNGQNQTYSGFLSVFCFLLAIFCLVLLIVFDTFATTTKC